MTPPRVRALAVLPLLLVLAGATATRAEQPVELSRLFPNEAAVSVEDAGLSRLVLPPEILAQCRPDLSDLRLFDPRGREVAFLVDGKAAPGTVEVTRHFESPPLEVARAEIRREDGPPLRRETFELGMPQERGDWVLVLETRQPDFVARLRIDGIGEGGEATALVANASVFRLRAQRRSEKLRLPLPTFDGKRLRVTLETEHRFWLEPRFRFESAQVIERGKRIAVPLEILSHHREDLRTVFDLSRPRGIVPDLLRIETATGTFDRKIEVWDQGSASAAAALGSSRIFRVQALVPVGEQELALRPARGDRLRVEIDDGDSPPLSEPRFMAVIRQPSLIFSVAAAEPGEVAATLRFGGGRAHQPRYDLSSLLPPAAFVATGKRAESAALLYDPAVVGEARLGAARANPTYDGAPALAFAMRPGATIDRRVFSHLRSLHVPAASEGLSRLRLGPEDLAVLKDDLSDLRVEDDASRQWPYLLERNAATDFVTLEIDETQRRDGTSRYVFRPAVSPLRFDRLLLDVRADYFDRAFRLESTDLDGKEKTLATGRLTRPIGDPRAVSVDVDDVRVESLLLVVEDGDDAPLAFSLVRARVLLPQLYLAAPEGRYALLLGAPDESSPRYELEHVRDVVLAVNAATIEVDPLEENQDYSLQARLKGTGLRQTVILWSVLIAAVVVLVLMTLRLAGREKPGS